MEKTRIIKRLKEYVITFDGGELGFTNFNDLKY